jgi:hypothetical protein
VDCTWNPTPTGAFQLLRSIFQHLDAELPDKRVFHHVMWMIEELGEMVIRRIWNVHLPLYARLSFGMTARIDAKQQRKSSEAFHIGKLTESSRSYCSFPSDAGLHQNKLIIDRTDY